VIQKSERPVQALNGFAGMFDCGRLRWDDLRVFRELAGSHSLRATARAEHVAVNTVRARLDRLERELGQPLVRRDHSGLTLTEAGLSLLEAARDMHGRVGAISGGGDGLIAPGELRIACGEGLGTLWLTPRLTELQAALPSLTINLRCDYDLERDHGRATDLQIGFRPPEDPDRVHARIGWLHLLLFASPDYLRERGTPTSFDEAAGHRFVEQVAPGVSSSVMDLFLGPDRPRGFIPIRTNSSMSMFWAVVSGAGIGALPTYARSLVRRLVPIDLPFQLRFPIYLHYHATARRSPAVRAAADWLRASFDPERYPWFDERFIHPRDFPLQRRGNVVSLFDSFVDAAA
jgi:DNA-binding transcriptional LysR family regulator